jgi:hypothetical protein
MAAAISIQTIESMGRDRASHIDRLRIGEVMSMQQKTSSWTRLSEQIILPSCSLLCLRQARRI